MAISVFPLTCEFRWLIANPFLPWQRSEATFYEHTSLIPTYWRAVILPLRQAVGFRSFSFSLKLYPPFGDHQEIRANSIVVNMSLNNNSILNETENNYLFSAGNQYMYTVEVRGNILNPEVTPLLEIDIRMRLQWQDTTNQLQNVHEARGNNLRLLSEDLERLLNEHLYSNMILYSVPDERDIFVHSYIIRKRWNRFFEYNQFHPENSNTVTFNTSASVLRDILTYIYSGVIDTSIERNAEHFAELSPVMKMYNMYHLYKCFAQNNLQQERTDSKFSYNQSFRLSLTPSNDGRVDNESYYQYICLRPQHTLILLCGIRRIHGAGPWLLYSLHSNSQIRLFVHMTWQFVWHPLVITRNGNMGACRTVYECDYTIDPMGSVSSEPVLFLGCPETYPELNPMQHGRNHFFCVSLHITDGIAITRIQKSHGTPLSEEVTLNTLSDDMFELYDEGLDSNEKDLEVVYGPDRDPPPRSRIHKGIFAIRVPSWHQVFENCQNMNEVPDTLRCHMSELAMLHVLDYLYTGKSSPITDDLIEEIEEFADQGDCGFLNDLARVTYDSD